LPASFIPSSSLAPILHTRCFWAS